jgi:hypothetical protein
MVILFEAPFILHLTQSSNGGCQIISLIFIKYNMFDKKKSHNQVNKY